MYKCFAPKTSAILTLFPVHMQHVWLGKNINFDWEMQHSQWNVSQTKRNNLINVPDYYF